MKQLIVALILALSPGLATAQFGWGEVLQQLGKSLQDASKQQIEENNRRELLEKQHRLEMERLERENQLRREEQARQREKQEMQREAQEGERRIAAAKKAREAEEERKNEINTGTGFFVAPDGHLITNAHVVRDKTTYAIRDFRGQFYKARLVSQDSERDLALLKIDGTVPSLKVGDSTQVVKGQRVIAVGFPQISIQGNESKVTDGIISSLSGLGNKDHWFQISVPIQGGNSGGPLVTENGIVIGVVVASVNVSKFYAMTGNLPQSVNFAIKSNLLLDFLKDQRVKNVATSKGKSTIDAVDSATVLVIAKNSSIDVSYAAPPEQSYRTERERAKQIAEEANRRKAEDAAEKKRLAMAAADEAKRQREERVADQKRQAEERLSEKRRLEEIARVARRDQTVQKAFPEWREIRESDVFVEWLREQPDNFAKMLDSEKASEVIEVFRRYQSQLQVFSDNYFERMGAWIADANGCKFLNPKPEPDESITWSGGCNLGRGFGEGELVWLKKGEPRERVKGNFKHGMLNGFGTKDDIGKSRTEGIFKNGKLEGQGKVSLSGGGGYEGSFRAGRYEGIGRMRFANGITYEGSFSNGNPNGQGTRTSPFGDKYVGEFKDGKFHGQGTFTSSSGSNYLGEFKDDQRDGQGTLIFPNGNKYVGEFKWGRPHGQGTLTFPNGNRYVGEFWDSQFHGQGTFTFAGGGKYIGEFKWGKQHGQGSEYRPDGTVGLSGIWENGNPVERK